MSNDKDIDESFFDEALEGGLPPEDGAGEGEFYDDEELAAGAGDADGEEGDWENYDPLADDEEKKKKSKRLNMMIIGGAMVVGVGIMYVKATGGSHAPVAVPAAQTAAADPGMPPTRMDVIYGKTPAMEKFRQETQEKSLPSPGFMNDPSALDKIADVRNQVDLQDDGSAPPAGANTPHEIEGTPPMPSPIAPAEIASQTPNVPAPPPADMGQQQPAPGVNMPQADALLKTPQAPGDAALPVPVAQPVPEAAPVVADETSATPAAEVSAGWASDGAMRSAPAPEQAAAPDPSIAAKLDDINGKLNVLETRLAAIEKGTVSKDEVSSLADAIDTVKAQIGTSSAPVAAASDAAEPAPVRHKASRSARKSRPAASDAAYVPPVAWVLKSAQPNMALVSPRGSQELRTVSVGDSLPGVGRITGIFMDGGRWAVQGTTGRISQ